MTTFFRLPLSYSHPRRLAFCQHFGDLPQFFTAVCHLRSMLAPARSIEAFKLDCLPASEWSSEWVFVLSLSLCGRSSSAVALAASVVSFTYSICTHVCLCVVCVYALLSSGYFACSASLWFICFSRAQFICYLTLWPQRTCYLIKIMNTTQKHINKLTTSTHRRTQISNSCRTTQI